LHPAAEAAKPAANATATAGWRRGYAADCKAPRFSSQTKSFPENSYQDKPGTTGEHDNGILPPEKATENENPGALAGATGADIEGFWGLFDNNLNRQVQASRIVEAVLDCGPEDRVLFLETILDQIRPGWPQSFNIDVMQEASWWADTATRPEIKAYAVTCYRRLSREDKKAFLNYITGAAA